MEKEHKPFKYRYKNGIKWQDVTSHSVTSGFTIDNLDTKEFHEAECSYEKLFILIRRVLEENDACCLDEEAERLQLCQDISDKLDKIFKKNKISL